MSFVSKGNKGLRNKARAAGPDGTKPLSKSPFTRKGDGHRPGANHNEAPDSMDKPSEPVSGDAENGLDSYADEGTADSQYDPASGKRAKSVADLRQAAKKISERSLAGEASPTGSEGGQDAKHLSSSKNESGLMKNAGMGKMDKLSKKPPRSQADQMADEMEDPMDQDEEDSGQYKMGMTPKGQSRKTSGLAKLKKKMMATEG